MNKRRRYKAKARRAAKTATHRMYGFFNDKAKREQILEAFKPFLGLDATK
jgi:hypothetical protein